ncbi:MAG: Ig-like domain-containing protein [Candidatus Sericytochromatia bacterium]|nr:Ig-like domain-containing protein [Candidatus Sericytochromatia bacterium]
MPRAPRLALALSTLALPGCLLVEPVSVTPEEGPWGRASETPALASSSAPPPPGSAAAAANGALKVLVSPGKPVMEPSESLRLIAEVQLADGQINGNVVWSSSDDTIATVNATTGAVTALREGRVTIVAAYALDTKVKGLAVLTIVKDKAATAPPPDDEAVPPPATKPEALPPQLAGSVKATPAPVETGEALSYVGPDGQPAILGPVLLTSGIHTFSITHRGAVGPFQVSLYTADGLLGENLYSGVGPLAVSFPYMIFQTGWYYLAVERAAGPWALTVD